MLKLIKIFIITAIICFFAQAAYDRYFLDARRYIASEVKQAKLLNLIIKYNLKPEGIEA